MIGEWYLFNIEDKFSDPHLFSTYKKDGSAIVCFKQNFGSHGYREDVKEGTWALDGKIISKKLQDRFGAWEENEYEIISLTKTDFIYKSLSSGFLNGKEYHLKKATDELKRKWQVMEVEDRHVSRPPKPKLKEIPQMPTYTAKVNFKDLQSVFHGFVKDYEIWNNFAQKNSEMNFEIVHATTAYHLIIDKYCTDKVVPQGVAYGSHSSHIFGKETVYKTDIQAKSATLYSVHKKVLAEVPMEDKYEYELVLQDDGRWLINELWYVDEDGKYPCL